MINIEYFKLPIEYIVHKEISITIKNDLELTCYKNVENEQSNALSLYKDVFEPRNLFSNATVNLWTNYFTTDVSFLTHTQNLIKNFKMIDYPINVNFDEIFNIYNQVTNDNNFIDKYQYIDISAFKHFNNNEHLLQTVSVVNLTSPLLSLLIPLILLIMPLFIFRLYGLNLNLSSYIFLLKQVFSKHPIGQVITNFSSSSIDKKIYLTITLIFYLFQMVQNARSCYRFYKNLQLMHDNLNKINQYIDYTLYVFDSFDAQIKEYSTYELFNLNMNNHKIALIKYKNELKRITPWKFSINKMFNIGTAMKNYYILNDDNELKQAIEYSFGLHGFIDNLSTLNIKLNNNELSLCKFNKRITKFKSAYYPVIRNKIIKNTYDLDKKLLITGPNASGKTTILKTTLLNIIFSQQIGMGFYKNATVKLYTHLHCYINIPDTSCRDSLFQAEARRCKEIIDKLKLSLLNENHFCIFDELYSGTNPYEAISSSIALLKYITNYSNIDFALTTHFLDVCKELNSDENFKNCCMRIINNEDDFQYTYKLIDGISQIKGGVKVLKDLEYPDKIIDDAKQLLKSLKI
jgi:hypothetical protein